MFEVELQKKKQLLKSTHFFHQSEKMSTPISLSTENDVQESTTPKSKQQRAPAHVAGSSSPAHKLTRSSSVPSASGRNGGQTTTEQLGNEKTAHPSFTNNSLHDKDK